MENTQVTLKAESAGGTTKIYHPILDWPLDCVIREDCAMSLQQVLRLYTVGHLLGAWQNRGAQKSIEDVFDTPEQAHHAISTCAAWCGYQIIAAPGPVPAWWRHEEPAVS